LAARKLRGAAAGWDDGVRLRIKTSMLANRLQDHVAGKCELSASQVQAALGLLRKTLPDLSLTENYNHVGGYIGIPTSERDPVDAAAGTANGSDPQAYH
jgi:hypothetical protein